VTQWRIDTPQSLDLEGVRRLNVRMVAGSIDVVGSSEAAATGGAHIEVSKLEGALTVTLEGDTLTIAHEKLTWGGLLDWVGNVGNNKASAVVSVSVPDACPVELGVVSADAVVSGITEDTKVKSVSGNVTLDGVNADISAQTVSGDLETTRVDLHQLAIGRVSALAQQSLNRSLRIVISSFAEMMESNAPVHIGDVNCWPVVVVESAPDAVVAIDRDRIVHVHLFHCPSHVVDVFLERELRRMGADHH